MVSRIRILFLILLPLLLSCQKGGGIFGDIFQGPSELTANEASQALKEALEIGVVSGARELGIENGFFGNALVRLALPEEAKRVERTLRGLGMGRLCDEAILSLNRAAEAAASESVPVFRRAILDMTFSDAMKILLGGTSEATDYLREKTSDTLQIRFMPITKDALDQVHATRYWNAMMTQYNRVPLVEPVETDLAKYVTGKTLSGLFRMIEEKELEIRNNPVHRTTALLKKAFGYADRQEP